MADPCVGRIIHQYHSIEEDKKNGKKLKKKKLLLLLLIVMRTQLIKDCEYSETSL